MMAEFTELVAKNVKPNANEIDVRIFERNENGKTTWELFVNNGGAFIMLPFDNKELAYGNYNALISILEGE